MRIGYGRSFGGKHLRVGWSFGRGAYVVGRYAGFWAVAPILRARHHAHRVIRRTPLRVYPADLVALIFAAGVWGVVYLMWVSR
jgi:hypothetical protein